ncbi:sensor histidine kinase [Staphylospora marina]|uniref:sensor histidine kinase n=1 Tax=Staphylospora marina TaxID=2490858 RepID=UPI000F5B8E2E|nr:HAMP domain-containing sensor histidine kinase [Staphylospora marina]
MKLRGRITWAFLWRLGLVFVLILGMYLVLWKALLRWSGLQEEKFPLPRDLLVEAVERTDLRSGAPEVDPRVLAKLDRRGGWLQILGPDGRQVFARGKPPDWPDRYAVWELKTWQDRSHETGWHLYTWHSSRDGKPYTWVMGLPLDDVRLLREIRRQSRWQDGRLTVPEPLLDRVEKSGGWLQVLDENGQELFSHLRPSGERVFHSPGSFIERYRHGTSFIHGVEEKDGKRMVFLLGNNARMQTEPGQSVLADYRFNQLQEFVLRIFPVILLVVILAVALLFGRSMGFPVLHMMDWLTALSNGVYREPVNRKGAARSRNPRTGKLRRPYRMFREVFAALQRLTDTLRENAERRRKLEETREEWLAGISHDLKTPLSSVKGYAALLAEESYEWDPAEMRRHARVILDKASHMEKLIEDLNLTFRLKNDALPLDMKETDTVELVRRAVVSLANHPRASEFDIRFEAPDEPVPFSVDSRWFLRMLDNLLTNALLHNPPGTVIRVSVSAGNGGTPLIVIEDNGRGMDRETVSRLFDRYFRGTSTADREGTGLGMAIARSLARAHGGDIQVDSEPGRGTRLTIRFDSVTSADPAGD